MHKNVMHKNDAIGRTWKASLYVGISQNVITAKGPFTTCTVYLGRESFIVRISEFAVSGRK